MATNRTPTPAVPTTTAQTDDAARGGLFANPDLTNVVTGVELAGASVANDSTITITFRQDGNTFETINFTLNQAGRGDFIVNIPDSGGGTPTPGGTGNPVSSGRLLGANLILTRADGTEVPPIDLSAFDFASDIAAVNTRIDDLNVPVNAADLADWPSGLPGQFLELDSNGDLTFAVPMGVRGSSIVAGNREDAFVAGTPPTLTGLAVAMSSGLQLTEQFTAGGVSTGTFVLEARMTPTGPTLPSGGGTPIGNNNVFGPNMDVSTTFNVDPGTGGGGINDATDIDVTITRRPTGAAPVDIVPDSVTVNPNDDTMYTVVIDEDDSNQEGDYEISTTPTITRPDGTEVDVTVPPVTYSRFIPFFHHTADIMTADLVPSPIPALVASGTEWNGEITFTVNGTGGTGHFAVQSSALPSNTIFAAVRNERGVEQQTDARISFNRAITTQDSEGEDIEYNIFQAQVEPRFTLHSFRTTRRP